MLETTEEVCGTAPLGVRDVNLRVHFPLGIVGVARMEAIWSYGPGAKMPTGVSFPLLILNSDAAAEEVAGTMMTLVSDCAEAMEEEEEENKCRRLAWRTGHALFATMVGDQDGIPQLEALEDFATCAGTPHLRALARQGIVLLDTILERELASGADADSAMDRFAATSKKGRHSLATKMTSCAARGAIRTLAYLISRPGPVMTSVLYMSWATLPYPLIVVPWIALYCADKAILPSYGDPFTGNPMTSITRTMYCEMSGCLFVFFLFLTDRGSMMAATKQVIDDFNNYRIGLLRHIFFMRLWKASTEPYFLKSSVVYAALSLSFVSVTFAMCIMWIAREVVEESLKLRILLVLFAIGLTYMMASVLGNFAGQVCRELKYRGWFSGARPREVVKKLKYL